MHIEVLQLLFNGWLQVQLERLRVELHEVSRMHPLQRCRLLRRFEGLCQLHAMLSGHSMLLLSRVPARQMRLLPLRMSLFFRPDPLERFDLLLLHLHVP